MPGCSVRSICDQSVVQKGISVIFILQSPAHEHVRTNYRASRDARSVGAHAWRNYSAREWNLLVPATSQLKTTSTETKNANSQRRVRSGE